mmetsp:Transcript_36515/g.65318  ORF Transcript_36515/g.65318 Transcript_36515/m.65318 type:complete len:87 (+) Transcript_36515:834-1094(+)
MLALVSACGISLRFAWSICQVKVGLLQSILHSLMPRCVRGLILCGDWILAQPSMANQTPSLTGTWNQAWFPDQMPALTLTLAPAAV